MISFGEILWDVFPDGERLGGAPFNFAAHAARLGADVIFVGAVGADDHGTRALAEARRLHVNFSGRRIPDLPTGYVTVEVDAAGQPDYVIHHPVAYDAVSLNEDQLQRLAEFAPAWICFGTLQSMSSQARETLGQLLGACPGARRFYDVNLRKQSFTPELVRALIAQADVVKLNQEEVRTISEVMQVPGGSAAEFCEALAAEHQLQMVCITRAEHGCAVWNGNQFCEAPGYPVKVADAVGAGDAFAAALVHGLSQQWPLARTCDYANRLGALVASRPGAVPAWTAAELEAFG